MFRFLTSSKSLYIGVILCCLVVIGNSACSTRTAPQTSDEHPAIQSDTADIENPPAAESETPKTETSAAAAETPDSTVFVPRYNPGRRPPMVREMIRKDFHLPQRKRHPDREKLGQTAIEEGWLGLSDAEFDEKIYEFLVGDMPPYEAIDELQTYSIYNSVILDRVDIYRAFEYLRSFDLWITDLTEETKDYATRILQEDPKHLEAQLYLAEKERDDAKQEAMYRQVLEDYPDSVYALIDLGRIVWKDRPLEAVELGKKAAQLGEPWGHVLLGYAYQRIGDYDTALVQMKKAHALSPLRDAAYHIRALEKGEPVVQPLASEPPAGETGVSDKPDH